MTDDRDNPEGGTGDDDALAAWLAANFPPKTPDAAPPADEPTPAGPPLASEPPPLVDPAPPTIPPTEPPPSGSIPSSSEPPGLPPLARELAGLPPETEVPADPTELLGGTAGANALDDLFGESRFRDYEAEPGPSQNPFAARPFDPSELVDAGAASATQEKPSGISRPQKVLLWIAGSLVAVLALLALFLAGTRLPDLLGPAPAVVVTPSNTPTPTPTPTALPLGPVDPGDYDWDELLGGECLDPYNGPWAEEFTVVDCAEPHPAQLAARGSFGTDDGFLAPYPGIEALQSQVNLLCTAPAVVDYATANAYTDIQFEASFAATAADWADGNRDYYCFLSRASGGPITGSIAVSSIAPAPDGAPTE